MSLAAAQVQMVGLPLGCYLPENAEMFFFEAISPPLSHTVALTLCNVAYR